QGLESNLALKQKNGDVSGAIYSLKMARRLFQPTVSFQGSYQTGAGGRSIALPVGDLLNPVYQSLNQMVGSNKFPTISNAEQDFLPVDFSDFRIRTTMPLINTEIKFNREIESQKVDVEKLNLEGFRLELARDIKVAYYNYLNALKVTGIYESALKLAKENARTNERLQQNGKGLPAYVLRARSEVDNTAARLLEAQTAVENAAMYFNFLLNRESVLAIDTAFDISIALRDAEAMINAELQVTDRAELKALRTGVHVRGLVVEMSRRYWMPKVNAFFDLGLQAQRFAFNDRSRYYNAGIQLEIPLFDGRRNLLRVKQAQIQETQSELALDENKKRLYVSAAIAKNKLLSTYQNYLASLKSVESAASYHRLIERGFKEGVHSFLEETDARNLLTAAQLQASLQEFN
ncbi:MAG: TolC family protein, partial [Sphingobacteriales bacterium]